MPDRLRRNRRLTRVAGASLAAVLVATMSSGCSFIHNQTTPAWSVTYEVEVDQPAGASLTDVSVEGAETRGDEPKNMPLAKQATSQPDGQGSTWKHEVIVLVKEHAAVRATPPAGAVATCRILLDGKREIAKSVSAAGKSVSCEARTPDFG